MNEQFTLEVQLNVEHTAGSFGEIAYRWFDEVSAGVAAEARAAVAPLAATVGRPPTPYGPLGEPGTVFGVVQCTRMKTAFESRTTERNASAAGMRWLRTQLADMPAQASMWFGRLDEHGHRSGRLLYLRARRLADSPDWLRLEAHLDESEFTDPVHGRDRQQRYLEAAWPFADEFDPGFGDIDYTFDGETTFETSLRSPERPRQWWDHTSSVNHCREFLRGYSWLTILPKELAAVVGGAGALTASGAFSQVRRLRHGGFWLLATDDYRDYDQAAVERVFRALAPALRAGTPTQWPRRSGESPQRQVFRDAAGTGS
ncbi:hypothetical protein [Catellatospora sp. NPDC049133]|uniref:hypothetical protein n=1 Tax=Catellatospora sp. NPDC049133 TaxID=3155499 RepID=UPI0033C6A127